MPHYFVDAPEVLRLLARFQILSLRQVKNFTGRSTAPAVTISVLRFPPEEQQRTLQFLRC